MILKEFAVRLGLNTDAISFAKGQLAVNALQMGLQTLANVARAAFHGVADGLIGFNARAEDAKLTLAAVAAVNLKMPFEQAEIAATALFEKLQDDAARTVATTEELVDFSTQIADPLFNAGRNMEQLGDFTTKAALAAKMLGLQGTAGLDIKQAIEGRVTARDRFANFLISSVGKMDKDKFNKIGGAGQSKAGQKARADQLEKWLNDPGLTAAIAKQEDTWSGIINGIKDRTAMMLGKIGKPLFDALKEPLKAFAKWIQANGPKIIQVVHAIGASFKAAWTVLGLFAKAVIGLANAFGPLLTSLIAITAAVALFGATSVAAALASAAAWAIAALAVLVPLAFFAMLILVIEDLYKLMTGGKSVIGDLLKVYRDMILEWTIAQPGDWWITRWIKEAIRNLLTLHATWTEFKNTFSLSGIKEYLKTNLALNEKGQVVTDGSVMSPADIARQIEDDAKTGRQSFRDGKFVMPDRNIGGGISTTIQNLTVQSTGAPEDVKRAVKQALDEHTATTNRAALEYFGGGAE